MYFSVCRIFRADNSKENHIITKYPLLEKRQKMSNELWILPESVRGEICVPQAVDSNSHNPPHSTPRPKVRIEYTNPTDIDPGRFSVGWIEDIDKGHEKQTGSTHFIRGYRLRSGVKFTYFHQKPTRYLAVMIKIKHLMKLWSEYDWVIQTENCFVARHLLVLLRGG